MPQHERKDKEASCHPSIRTVVIRRNGLGDLLMTYPLLKHMKSFHPNLSIDLVVDQKNAELLAFFKDPLWDNVYIFGAGNKYLKATELALRLRRGKYDVIFSAKPTYMRMLAFMMRITSIPLQMMMGSKPKEKRLFCAATFIRALTRSRALKRPREFTCYSILKRIFNKSVTGLFKMCPVGNCAAAHVDLVPTSSDKMAWADLGPRLHQSLEIINYWDREVLPQLQRIYRFKTSVHLDLSREKFQHFRSHDDLSHNDDSRDGLKRDGLKCDSLKCDSLGYDSLGYDSLGYDSLGYDSLGYDNQGSGDSRYFHIGDNRMEFGSSINHELSRPSSGLSPGSWAAASFPRLQVSTSAKEAFKEKLLGDVLAEKALDVVERRSEFFARRHILVNLSNNRAASRLAPAQIAQCIEDINHFWPSCRVMILGMEGDIDGVQGEEVSAALMPIKASSDLYFCRSHDLETCLSALACSDLVITGDGGLMHMAAAMGRYQIALFAETDPIKWHPLTLKASILAHPKDVREIDKTLLQSAVRSICMRMQRDGY